MRACKTHKSMGYGGYGSGYSGTTAFAEIHRMINAGQFTSADAALEQVPAEQRDAEWHFLKGCILFRRGWYHDATKYFDTACRLDPNNQEYRNVRLQIERMSQNNGGGTYTYGCGNGCDCCTNLLILDCCCACCGGDLISCC